MIKSERATGFPSRMGRMRIVMWTLFLVVTPIQGKIQCYVCDWNKDMSPDNSSVSVKVVDTCTPHNFQADKAGKVDCDGGCEAKSYKDSKNNELIHFFRNCISSSSGQLKDDCFNTQEKANHYYSTCECITDLCNSSDKSLPFISLLGSLLFISFFIALAQNTLQR